MRPGDDDAVPMVDALAWQQEYVEAAGAPTAALILEAVRDDLVAGGPLAAMMPAGARFGDLPGVRVLAAVHRLALDREAPGVAVFLPTVGGRAPETTAERSAFRRSVVAALAASPDRLADSLARTPQTNEVGRAALLRCALSRLDPPLPVRLLEIGASAGLNLRADLLPGDPRLEAGPLPAVIERRGCDLAPVDIGTPEGRALLASYVWVDDVPRFRRLAEAMAVAARVPAVLEQSSASTFVEGLGLQEGSTTVLWHSAMRTYLDPQERTAVDRGIAALGALASRTAPFAHVSYEWDSGGAADASFALVSTRWADAADDGRPRTLARGRSHGEGVTLTTPTERPGGRPAT